MTSARIVSRQAGGRPGAQASPLAGYAPAEAPACVPAIAPTDLPAQHSHPGAAGVVQRAADTQPNSNACRCGRPLAFDDTRCPACRTPQGYDPQAREMLPLDAVHNDRLEPVVAATARYRRCSRLDTAAACNWLVAEGDVRAGVSPLCRSCRLTRVLPDLSQPGAAGWWHDIERAKRRLVATLIGLQLPVRGRDEDATNGLAFDLLRAEPGAPAVSSGQANGVVTVDVEAADDAWRRQLCMAQGRPYRSLWADLCHDSAGAYWQTLVANGPWQKPCRDVFGDEGVNHATAMRLHERNGAMAGWATRFISSFASSHPAEDWAETWAAYLHMVDTLETARGYGLGSDRLMAVNDLLDTPLGVPGVPSAGDPAVAWSDGPQADDFARLVRQWQGLAHVLNALSHSMGVADAEPRTLPPPVLRKLFLVHSVIAAARER